MARRNNGKGARMSLACLRSSQSAWNVVSRTSIVRGKGGDREEASLGRQGALSRWVRDLEVGRRGGARLHEDQMLQGAC